MLAVPERALIFDGDGVLIEPWGFAMALENDYGIERSRTKSFFLGPFQECLTGKARLHDVLSPYLDYWGWKGSIQDLIRLWMESEDRPSISAFEAIDNIRRPEDIFCLASNQEAIRARYIAEDMGFASRCDRLYFSHELGTMKPHWDYYRAIERDLRMQPSQIHFWDDSAEHVGAATRLGWNAYVYEGPQSIARVAQQRRFRR